MINDSRSSSADVTSGIAQGSILGPMLFICYINDMPTSVQSSIYLFADDAKLYRNIALDDDPRTPARPSATGEMVKGMAVAIQRKQVQAHAPDLGRQNQHRNYTMGATILVTTTSEKDLGVYVDTELTFEKNTSRL